LDVIALPLKGFRISNFRSFSAEPQQIGPLKKFNIIIGENNSGKSNVARYVQRMLYPVLNGNLPIKFDPRDKPQRSARFPDELVLILVEVSNQLFDLFLKRSPNNAVIKAEAKWFIENIRPAAPTGHVWVPLRLGSEIGTYKSFVSPELLDQQSHSYRRLHNLWQNATGTSGGMVEHWLNGLFPILAQFAKAKFKLVTIPAGRKIESALTDRVEEFGEASTSAKIFIQKLATFERPQHTLVSDKSKWAKIQNFVRTVMKDETIEIEIPSSQDTINFNWNGRYLPIEDLGTGVYQAVILAARATIIENSVICIEEPELHFHPELQRQIMQYLDDQTNNQYFITTHSAHVMDSVDGCIISVRLDENGNSKIDLPMKSQDRRQVCHRLGYRPSDLLQSNCLIWVEGPSDRFYLKSWIKAVDSNLQEGWHYAFALYGGRLLSNFSAEDDETGADEFIQLLPINRFPAVVMDSDIKESGKSINATKKRIKDEVDKVGGYCWITDGREIENYISRKSRIGAIKAVHKNASELESAENTETKWSHPLAYKTDDGTVITERFDKPGIAEVISEHAPEFSILDLKARVGGLVDFIHMANRMTVG
jgi:energy-coupling factor transporter ATP-binding protein EcfA2